MKKNLNRCLGVIMASTILSASVLSGTGSVLAAQAEGAWIKGWTGSSGSSDYSFNNESETSVQLENTKVNSGKFSDGEDSIIYYAKELSNDTDFTISADVTVDELSMGDGASNPNQSSVGIAIIDELYSKSEEKTYTNGVFLGTWAKSKNDNVAFYGISRNNSDTKSISSSLSDPFANKGSGLGTYKLSLKKRGTTFTLSCNGKEESLVMDGFKDEIYPCLYIARNAKATFSNVSIDIDTRKVTGLSIEGSYKTNYFYGEPLDLSGSVVTAYFDDGSSEVISGYAISGYDAEKAGAQEVKLTMGDASTTVPVTVNKIGCSNIDIQFEPLKTVYYAGNEFSSIGFQGLFTYENGESETLTSKDYELKLDGKAISNTTILGKDMVGTHTVTVTRKDSDGYTTGTASASYQIEVKDSEITSLEVTEKPVKSEYYVNDKIDTTGLRVSAIYADGGKVLLNADEYKISEFDTSSAGAKKVVIAYGDDEKATTEYDINVKERTAQKLVLASYPRTTYPVGSEFSQEGMAVAILYDNGDIEETKDFSVDTSKFDSSKEGKTSVTIVSSDGKFDNIDVPVTIVREEKNIWRKAIFGQSASVEKEESGAAGVKADNYGTVEGNINVRAWEGTGKITADHDGIVYYYTHVDGEDNFTLSADVTVKKYLEHNNDDTKRNGQEAFGIMARDIVPLVDENGNQTISYSAAKKDEDGAAVTQEKSAVFASNVIIVGGYSGKGWPSDPNASYYETQSKLNRINMYARTGVTATDGGGNKFTPVALSSSFPKEGNKYRITLTKLNGAMYAKCYDYETGETKENYLYDDSILKVQNDKDMYVGFFASRWADIDVSNVEFYESDKSMDKTVESETSKRGEAFIKVASPKYSKDTNYDLQYYMENTEGTVTVKQNDKIIAENMPVKSGTTTIKTTLEQGKHNKFVIVFTPDDKQKNLAAYKQLVARADVYNRDFDNTVSQVFVSPDGKADAQGTEAAPLDLDTAAGFIAPGQTIIMKEGEYKRSEALDIPLGNNGEAGKLKTIAAQDGAKVVIDMQKKDGAAVVTGNYWKFKGIEFKNSADNVKCFHLGGSNCVVEDCVFHDNGDLGLQISRTYSTDDKSMWPSNNLILNCESYNNCDPSMINADGFGCKLTVGEGNVFKNCSSHHNVDDGWDLYTKVNSGAIGSVTLENCVAYKNGLRLLADGSDEPYGAGGHNGFKLGGENVSVKHKLINCMAYENLSNGITTNSNPALSLENVLSYSNQSANFRLYTDKPENYSIDATDCISYKCGKNECDIVGTINKDSSYTNNSDIPLLVETNFWQTDVKGETVNIKGQILSDDYFKEKQKELKKIAGVQK